MTTIFMNSDIRKTSARHSLVLNLIDKTDLHRGDARVLLSNLNLYYTWKNI